MKSCGIKSNDLIRSITNNSENYDEKCMKTKFNSDDDDLPSKKTLELRNVIKVIRSGFHEGNKYYLQVF